MSSTRFSDPIDLDSIVQQIKNAQTIGSIYEIVNNVFPDWILNFVPDYCLNYPHLKKNWHYVCKQNNFKPSQIIIVNYISDDRNHSLMNIFLDVFYRAGFIVRLIEHIAVCPSCKQVAVPTKFLYDKFIERDISTIPNSWTPTCKNCNDTENNTENNTENKK
jgi:hypothetical protein